MPVVREIHISKNIRAAVWHIAEDVESLQSIVQPDEEDLLRCNSFRSLQRKSQWLACRALLMHMLSPQSVKVVYDSNGKPALNSGLFNISISHTSDYAAAVISETCNPGIDIEQLKNRIERVKTRFLHEDELKNINPPDDLSQLYYYWCGKEALYKIHGLPGVDFRNDIRILPIDYLCRPNGYGLASIVVDGMIEERSLYFEMMEGMMLVVAY